MKPVVAAFNQEKALVGAFSVIVKTDCESDLALHSTTGDGDRDGGVKSLCVDTSVLALDTTPENEHTVWCLKSVTSLRYNNKSDYS